MFGKGKSKKSSTDRFVTAKGREAGNLRSPTYPNKTGPAPKKGKPVYKEMKQRITVGQT